ncbi:hypothetical protein [Pseudomonas sp. 24 E 1]|nr:hypothetical protein [Pseudomonas sp. 24 R 17]CRM33027.1 hypothetical protein [Pseudomonas sp. 24 E 1]
MLLPSRTVCATRNWPDSGWYEKSGALGLRFFCVLFRVTEVISSQASLLPHLTALMRMYSINVGAGLPAMPDYLLVHGLS